MKDRNEMNDRKRIQHENEMMLKKQKLEEQKELKA